MGESSHAQPWPALCFVNINYNYNAMAERLTNVIRDDQMMIRVCPVTEHKARLRLSIMTSVSLPS